MHSDGRTPVRPAPNTPGATMTDPSSTKSGQVKKAAQAVADLASGEKSEPAAKGAAPAKPEEAESAAKRARKKYDATLKWVLGIFSAIGILVFGSVPFADLSGVNGTWLLVGLSAAGVGLAIVILAATASLELQDASLGELEHSFAIAKKEKKRGKRRRPWPRSVRHANQELRKIVEGSGEDEAQAHLGPGIKSVENLILRLYTLSD